MKRNMIEMSLAASILTLITSISATASVYQDQSKTQFENILRQLSNNKLNCVETALEGKGILVAQPTTYNQMLHYTSNQLRMKRMAIIKKFGAGSPGFEEAKYLQLSIDNVQQEMKTVSQVAPQLNAGEKLSITSVSCLSDKNEKSIFKVFSAINETNEAARVLLMEDSNSTK